MVNDIKTDLFWFWAWVLIFVGRLFVHVVQYFGNESITHHEIHITGLTLLVTILFFEIYKTKKHYESENSREVHKDSQ